MSSSKVSLLDWPRISRFYGIGPDELAGLPNAVIEMYAKQLPAIQAEELELAIMASDMPHAEEKDRKATFRRIARFTRPEPPTVEPPRRRFRRKPVEGAEKPASPINENLAAAYGFTVVRGDRKPPEPKKEPE